jgi:chromosome segregation ATPase
MSDDRVALDALARVMEELSTARRLLEEVSAIGLWSKSDDSSDNRRKRKGLRETDWAVSGALRALTELRSHQSDVPASLSTLEDELRVLVGVLEPLPDTVTDTMGENALLDSAISNISDKVSELLERASRLAAEYR